METLSLYLEDVRSSPPFITEWWLNEPKDEGKRRGKNGGCGSVLCEFLLV